MKAITQDTIDQLAEIYAVINDAGGIVSISQITERIAFSDEANNRIRATEALNHYYKLGFIIKHPPLTGQHKSSLRYSINPDRSDFLRNAYTVDQSINNKLEDDIVDTLTQLGAMDAKQLTAAIPDQPTDAAGRPNGRARQGRVTKACHELIARRVLGEGPAGFYVRGAK